MDPAIAKLVITGLVGIGGWYAFTPPSYTSTGDKLHVDGMFGYVAYKLAILTKMMIIAPMLCQMISIAATQYPSLFRTWEPLTYVCHSTNPQAIASLSWQFLIGSTIVISMAAVRVWCYQALGSLFTFQVTIRPDHRLIITGPYNYVRHPGYTALIGVLIGVNIVSMDRQGWVTQCDMLGTSLRWWIYAFFLNCAFTIPNIFGRGKMEDEWLKDKFKDEWLAYSKKVPHRYIPGCF